MKVYIFCDIEGISGIPASCFITGERPELNAFAVKRMAADINACIAGCFEAGADEVIVRDGHSAGYNVTAEMIDSRAGLVQGSTPRKRFAEIEGSDALILLGYHAMAGTAAAVLEHSYSSKEIQNVWLNGRKVGEVGIDAAIAGEYDIPVIMVSGDDKCCSEAAEWIPGVYACEVKKGWSSQGAYLYPLREAERSIRETTVKAIRGREDILPLKIELPATMRWEMIERKPLPDNANVEWVDGRTYEKSGLSVEKLLLE